MSRRIRIALEVGAKRAFATAIDWPGWSRSGKSPDLALAALAAAAPRYALVALEAGEAFPDHVTADDLDVVEQADGGGGTDFGVPSRVTDADRQPTGAIEADRLRRLVAAAWATFDRVAAGAPLELRKGPRGGGRDRDRIVAHVQESDAIYAREIGARLQAVAPGGLPAEAARRAAMLEALGSPSDRPRARPSACGSRANSTLLLGII